MQRLRQRLGEAKDEVLYLGADGGGTRTTVWVSNGAGRVLGRGVAGPSNPVKVGLALAEREILAAARQALAQAGGGALQAVCLGLAGADRPEISGPLAAWLRKHLPARFHLITTDAAVALAAALGEDSRAQKASIVVIAGTGSIACARCAHGRILRCGGWGAVFGDEGSGYDLARNAVRAALRAFDGRGSHTRLAEAITHALRLESIIQLPGRNASSEEIAALAPVVIKTARAGDAVARQIVDDAGRKLAELALALIPRLGSENASLRVVCAGGLFRASAALRRSFACHVKEAVPGARISLLRREPVEGALALARRASQPEPATS
ncbi:MAG TPA: BadF/BadG/BcrA/BcrD ATPase family protein [Terriglobia bacterium]|nr:BadF/BadG/BcrA/BcrD ATPase family protein [Terriglobia bacterium]